MNQARNIALAQELLAGIAQGSDPDDIASLFSADVTFDIPGDVGALPWIGHRTGRPAVVGFIRGTRAMTEVLSFDIEDIAASETRAIIVGALASRIVATGKVVETAIAIILVVGDGQITRFQMLEDSFAVSRAARG